MRIYAAWIIGFVTAIIATLLLFFKGVGMWFDERYVDSLNLPPDGDSLGIPIFSTAILGFFVLVGVVAVYIALMAIHLSYHSFGVKVKLRDALLKRRNAGRNTFKIIFTILTLLWVVLFNAPFFYEYVNGLFLVTDIASVVFGIVSLVATCMVIDKISLANS